MNRNFLSAAIVAVAALSGSVAVCAPVEMQCEVMHKPSGQHFFGSGIKWTAGARAMSDCEKFVNQHNATASANDQYSTKECTVVSCEPVITDPLGM